uniref:hypothetical protein n=1 Tax=Anaerococcus mediterraneensis TaxID=1870984 RepID=UPI000931FBA5|nr:hypothetical protein [Anaerococcus mediterraneensis]
MKKPEIIFKKIIAIAGIIVASNALDTRDNIFIRLLAAIVLVASFFEIFNKGSWKELFSANEN